MPLVRSYDGSWHRPSPDTGCSPVDGSLPYMVERGLIISSLGLRNLLLETTRFTLPTLYLRYIPNTEEHRR